MRDVNFCILDEELTNPQSKARDLGVHGPYSQDKARALLAQFATVLRVRWRDDRVTDMDLEFEGQDQLSIKENGVVFRKFKVQAMFASRKMV